MSSLWMRQKAGDRPSTRPGVPDTISFGRPVEPPEVGAFQDGEIVSGRSLSSLEASSNSFEDTTGRSQSNGTLLTTIGVSANSTMALSSASGRRDETGCGTAPSFHAA